MADAERTVPLRKEVGGVTLTGPDGKEYTWAKDGDVVDVPYDWALELLAIKGGGFSVADEKQMEKARADADAEAATIAPDDDHSGRGSLRTVTEPDPGVEGRVLEPDPGAVQPQEQVRVLQPRRRAGTQAKDASHTAKTGSAKASSAKK